MEIIKTESLSFYDDLGTLIVPAKQYDTGRIFKFELSEPIEGASESVIIKMLTSDNLQIKMFGVAKYEDDVVTIDMSLPGTLKYNDDGTTSLIEAGYGLLGSEGMNLCELIFTGSDKTILTSWTFKIYVQESVHDESDITNVSYDNIREMVEKVANDAVQSNDLANKCITLINKNVPLMKEAISCSIGDDAEYTGTKKDMNQYRPDQDTDNAKYFYTEMSKMYKDIGRPLQTKGTCLYSALPQTLTKDMVGYTYNISNEFIIESDDERFLDGIKGSKYQPGTNVYVVNVGTEENPICKYDILAGYNYWYGTTAEYIALATKNPNTLYFTNDGEPNLVIATNTQIDGIFS